MKKAIPFLTLALILVACNSNKEKENNKKENENMNNTENPLLSESKLPYGAPDFSAIKDHHFKPAMLEGIEQQKEAVSAIANSKEAPTFNNTVLALEQSGQLLSRASQVFNALASAHTNETIQAIEEDMAPKFAAQNDMIYLNEALFKRFKILYDKKETLNLDAESLKLLEEYYENFEIEGANLSSEDKEILKQYNERIATLTTKFGKTLLDANNAGAVTFANEEELKGVDADVLKSLQNKDGNGYKIPLQNTTQQPLLQSMENRASREKLYKAAWHRANQGKFDTSELIKELVEVRAQKAKLLGFNNFAEWSLQKTMAKTPANVTKFFNGLIPAATAKAQAEANEIQKMIKSQGQDFTLQPWDWNYYAEMVRKQKYDLDVNQIKPYFEINNVLEKGVFYAANKLYGITYKPRTDIPIYHPDVKVYELFEEDGSQLGLFYTDFFARPSKGGGAWMGNFVTQSKLYNKKPVIYNVCNYPKPANGQPALLTYDEVETMFHEFGHALHGFFADQQYPSLSGTDVARDFVEFPSQFNENWALYPEILKNYAIHYKTGEQIPQALIDKIKNSGTFNQGYSLTENLAGSNLDMQWHTIPANKEIAQVNVFETEALNKTKLDAVQAVPPRYRSTYFSHIFAGGYAAGYYSYSWTEMLHHDAYNWFENNGGLTRENGQRFREMVLSRGNTLNLEKMYKEWRGSDPKIEPMLKARGLK
ncbi:M3 family metallopeptidase [Aequorivita sp. SDUM287046]|uniref:M3 family metallopeptidase n=1 Tax=Aequorivita aurantiaca TaxID=3053356 RepID=A0ABT8DQY7_9FLAO|nr:M3 family metallopeptidase [Aequorivita aurantiaca]MDN3725482.1 M3 family metallopeptidase [Aequorivita aurantiaca]